MTLLQIRNIVDYILNLQEAKIKLTKERFMDLLKVANLQYFEEQVRQKNWDNLKVFTKVKGDHMSAPLSVAGGVMQCPEDFYQPISAFIQMPTGTGYKPRVMEKCDSEIFDERQSNPATTPSFRYPIINYKNGYARVRPQSVKKVYLTYLILPTDPVYAQKVSGGVNVYDSANSVQLQWTEDCQVDVMRIVLEQLGIKMGRGDIYQVMEAQANKEEKMTV
jgi:hypothetical protein